MKKVRLIVPGLILTALAVYVSCRKIDNSNPSSQQQNVQARFFLEHAPTDAGTKAALQFVKGENDKYDFVGKLTKQLGYPRWDKSLVFPYEDHSALINAKGGTDSATIIYIPFVRDSQRFVNSALIMSLSSRDTVFQLLMDWQYNDMGYDTAVRRAGWNAWDVFHLFTLFDNRVFKHTKFSILDKKLFAGDSVTAILVPDTTTGHGRLEAHVDCSFYQIITCYIHSNGRVLSMPACTVSYTAFCTTTWVNIGDPPGGGGGGGGGWTPPDPCHSRTTQPVDGVPGGCGGTGGGGWVPVGVDEPPVPPNDSTMAANLKRAYEKAKSMADSLHTKAQQNGNERTFSYMRTSIDTMGMYPLEGTPYFSNPRTGLGIFGINHTHQDDGTPNGDKNQCFDGPDIFKFYYLSISGQPIEFQTVTTRDYVYAAVITDPDLFKSHCQLITHTRDIKVMKTKLHDLYVEAMDTCVCNWEKQNETGLLAITANNNPAVSGIRIFKSPRNNINFVPLQ